MLGGGTGAALDVLRRAIGSPGVLRIAPHVTLVPPLNLNPEALGDARRVVADAAAVARPLALRLGPVVSFAPRTPTVHLAVHGVAPADDRGLAALRSALLEGPLDRPEQRRFVPHVTLDPRVASDRIPAVLTALSEVDLAVEVAAVHLLEHVTASDAPPHWRTLREEPLGGPSVVGRGGIELSLRTTTVVEPDVAELIGSEPSRPGGAAEPGDTCAAVAERDGSLAGAAVGRLLGGGVARLDAVVVVDGERGLGIGTQVLRAWCSAAAAGAGVAVTAPVDARLPAGFLERLGWTAVGDRALRVL